MSDEGTPPQSAGAAAVATPTLTLADAPDPALRQAILGPLVAYNEGRAGATSWRPLAVLAEDPASGAVTGGLWAHVAFRWMFVELLVVPEGHRRAGLGTRMMRMAEAEARRHDCVGVWLDTFSFQARGFYERLGYAVFGEIPDYPPGHARYFLSKRLDAPS